MAETPADSLRVDDAWILSRRGPRNAVDPRRPYAFLVEPEHTAGGRVEDVGTIFITNRECPFRCLMCDLWKNTTINRVPAGSVAEQISFAILNMPPVRHLKLYNSGNFFDEKAIRRSDLPAIVNMVRNHETVIVESHPKLVDGRCTAFARQLRGRFQVAMGLETVDPDVLPRLNKRMTLDDYARAAAFLTSHDIDVRAFILLRAPFQSEEAGEHWAKRSIEWAFSNGVECCAVIPTRAGNGAMETLATLGHFEPPSLAALERVHRYGLSLGNGRVFVDLWDAEKFSGGPEDDQRIKRMAAMNLSQRIAADGDAGGAA